LNSAQPVRLALSPSVGLAALVVGLHAAAAAAILTVLTGWLAFAAAVFFAVLGAAAAWDRALLASRRSPRAIEIQPSGEAFCLLADGRKAAIGQAGGNAVTRYWVSLRLSAPAGRSFLVAGSMLPAASFRLLRLWALWGKLPGVAPGQLSGRS
jgi:hypothetical protein